MTEGDAGRAGRLSKEAIAAVIKAPAYIRLKRELTQWLRKAYKDRFRVLVALSGDDSLKQAIALADILITFIKFFTKLGRRVKVLYAFHDEFTDALQRKKTLEAIIKRYLKSRNVDAEVEFLVYEVSERCLGMTYQAAVLDFVNSLRPVDVGRLVGIVEGGGLVVLLTPKWDEWHERKNLFQLSLTVPQHPEPRKVFVRWFKEVTKRSDGVIIYDVDSGSTIYSARPRVKKYEGKAIELPRESAFPLELYRLALTQDQVKAINLLETLIDPPKKPFRRATIMLIADRGRGKSSAIGIGIVGLIHKLMNVKNRIRVGVTAPSLSNVQALMHLAIKALDKLGLRHTVVRREDMVVEVKGEKFSLEYWEPATIVNLDLDVAVVDEAAGIPVPLLHRIWKRFRRTVFATTIHGYEGAGRGFSVRFMKRIKESKDTKLMIYEMEEPIRYSKDDPVERWQFRVLLLDAEPVELNEEDLKLIEQKELRYLVLNPEELFTLEKEHILRALFGIYVLAHYRNEPDDLAMMADAPHHSIRGLALSNGKIVAAAQLAEEGPIPIEYVESLLRGGRIPGNIIPDRLLKHGRLREIAEGRGWRIVRIAVHPDVQGKGLGSYLLSKIVEEAMSRGYDWVGTGFGATSELLSFWLKNGFIPLHISPDRNPVSAEYTLLMIKPISDKWKSICEHLNKEFREKVLESLHDTYRDLEVDVAHQLLASAVRISHGCAEKPPLSPIQMDRLLSYVSGYMTYESCSDVITLLVKHYWRTLSCRVLSPLEERLTIAKVLQGLPWDTVSGILGVKKSRLIDDMRRLATKLIEAYFNLSSADIDKLLGKVSLSLVDGHLD